MKLHSLKIDIEAIELKYRGVKNWEIRYDDRGYCVGDVLFEREFNQNTKEYGKNCIVEKIVGILPKKACYGLKDNFVILVTQPLYYGEYDKIQELVAFGDNCFSLVDAVCKMFKYEDYNVWQNQEKYNWQVVADYVFNNKSFDTVCNEVMRS